MTVLTISKAKSDFPNLLSARFFYGAVRFLSRCFIKLHLVALYFLFIYFVMTRKTRKYCSNSSQTNRRFKPIFKHNNIQKLFLLYLLLDHYNTALQEKPSFSCGLALHLVLIVVQQSTVIGWKWRVFLELLSNSKGQSFLLVSQTCHFEISDMQNEVHCSEIG